MSNSSGKNLVDVSHSHLVSLMYNVITSVKDSNDLFFGFDRDCGRRQDELACNKNVKGLFHLRIMLKDAFGFAKHQKKLHMAQAIN